LIEKEIMNLRNLALITTLGAISCALIAPAWAVGSENSLKGKSYAVLAEEIAIANVADSELQDEIDQLVADVNSIEGDFVANAVSRPTLGKNNPAFQVMLNAYGGEKAPIVDAIGALSAKVSADKVEFLNLKEGNSYLAADLQAQILEDEVLIGNLSLALISWPPITVSPRVGRLF
jgi:hypothetical protein